jgi:hypothetical protein
MAFSDFFCPKRIPNETTVTMLWNSKVTWHPCYSVRQFYLRVKTKTRIMPGNMSR